MQATKIGLVNIEVEALTNLAKDTSKKQINILPEGVPVYFNFPFFLNNLKPPKYFTTDVKFSFPDTTVPESSKTKVKVTGDLLGLFLDIQSTLMNPPDGCGEQNLLRLTTHVQIAKYLHQKGQLKGEVKDEALENIAKEYQSQLTYQRDDGSFSDFGKLDSHGSVSMTAAVALVLNKASQFVYIDPIVIIKSIAWLIAKQDPHSGYFIESRSPSAESSFSEHSNQTLTSLVLLALKKNEELSKETDCVNDHYSCDDYFGWSEAATKSIGSLEKDVVRKDIDHLSLAVSSYALQIVGNQAATKAIARLKDLLVEEGMNRTLF